MRYKTLKHLLAPALLFFISFCTIPPSCDAGSAYSVRSAAKNVIFAILGDDLDALMELSQSEGSFQLDKKNRLSKFLARHLDEQYFTNSIEIESVSMRNDENAKVMVTVQKSTIDAQGGLSSAPIVEIWNFTKGKKGRSRGKWLFLIKN